MIRIEKSVNVPVILTDKGESQTALLFDLYTANPDDYNNGIAIFTLDKSIYGHKSVKNQLIADQHGKCCFCEADFTANSFGDVEHYRPKGGHQNNISDSKLNRPGYYRLAYNWENLFFSCEVCNRREKKNYFPITGEVNRAVNHTQPVLVEQPLLIHPSLDDPEKHIGFHQHVPIALDERGRASIEGYGLNREKLNRVRERHHQVVAQSIILAAHDPSTMDEDLKDQLCSQTKLPWNLLETVILNVKVTVQNAAKSNQPFASMIRSNFDWLPKNDAL